MARNQRAFKRADRINKQLLELISSMFLFDISDHRVKSAQITAVQTASDLSFARVFYTLFDTTDENAPSREEVQEALDNVVGFVRSQLSARVQMRRLPELRFVYDESIETGKHIESLLSNITYSNQGEQD